MSTLYRILPACFDRPIEIAKRKARETGQVWAVASLDAEDHRNERMIIPCPEGYADTEEFFAFDGKLVVIVYPDGRIE